MEGEAFFSYTLAVIKSQMLSVADAIGISKEKLNVEAQAIVS